MLTPILRLVLVYVVLIAGVLAVFNRDRVMPLIFGAKDEPVAVVQPVQPVAPAPVATTVAPTAAPVAQPEPAAQPAPVTMPPLETPVADAPATEPSPSPVTDPVLAQAINDARGLFWAGKAAEAEAALIALTQQHPDNPDLFGELGNLHFAMQAYDKAAADWHAAGLLLIEQNRSSQLLVLLPVIQNIAPDKAADLGARLQNR